jgi:hypothetical protein
MLCEAAFLAFVYGVVSECFWWQIAIPWFLNGWALPRSCSLLHQLVQGFVRGCNCFSIYTMYHRENRTEETNHHTRMSSFVQEDSLENQFCYVLISPCRTMACKEKLVQTAGSPSPQTYHCYLCVISIYLMYIYISCIYRDTYIYIYNVIIHIYICMYLSIYIYHIITYISYNYIYTSY